VSSIPPRPEGPFGIIDLEDRRWDAWLLPATAPLPANLVGNGCRIYPVPSFPGADQLRFDGGALRLTWGLWDAIKKAAPYLDGIFFSEMPPPNIQPDFLLLLEEERPEPPGALRGCPYCGHTLEEEEPF